MTGLYTATRLGQTDLEFPPKKKMNMVRRRGNNEGRIFKRKDNADASRSARMADASQSCQDAEGIS